MAAKMLRCIFVVVLAPLLVSAHVRLLDPPARWPPRDFLNTFDTPQPCGVPAGERKSARSYLAGSAVDIVWASPYVHNGGYTLQLLDAENQVVAVLKDTITTQSVKYETVDNGATVILPNEPCKRCTLRLMRQALEWGPTYKFMSCADIDVVSDSAPACFNGGTLQRTAVIVDGETVERTSCICPPAFFGDKCQVEVDCKAYPDCGQEGKCEQRDNEAPARVCYCELGRFGRNCEKESPALPDCVRAYVENGNSECYHQAIELGDDNVAYIRNVGNELEMIVDMATTSWVGVGFRSTNANKSCKLAYLNSNEHFRSIEPNPTAENAYDGDTHSAAEPEPSGESHAEPEPEPTGESTAEPEPEPTGESTAEPEPSTESASAEPEPSTESASAEPEPSTESSVEPEPSTEATVASDATTASTNESDSTTVSAAAPDSTSESTVAPESTTASTAASEIAADSTTATEALDASTAAPETTVAPTAAPESSTVSTAEPTTVATVGSVTIGAARRRGASISSSEPEPEPEIVSDLGGGNGGVFTRMDCLDMVIGSVVDGRQRVMDAFTLDKSTPQRDELWGGENSLTGAWAFERGNRTIVAFRRPLSAARHWSDVTLGDSELMMAWAHGGPPAEMRPVDLEHYKDDYLRYHHANRGVVDLVTLREGGAASLAPALAVMTSALMGALLL